MTEKQRKIKNTLKYIFLLLGAAAAVYTIYLLGIKYLMNFIVEKQFTASIGTIGGADGPTTIFASSYSFLSVGNWMLSGGFSLACLDMYSCLRGRKRKGWILSIISIGLSLAGCVVWIYQSWDIFQYWEGTWDYNFPAVIILIELVFPFICFILRTKRNSFGGS